MIKYCKNKKPIKNENVKNYGFRKETESVIKN